MKKDGHLRESLPEFAICKHPCLDEPVSIQDKGFRVWGGFWVRIVPVEGVKNGGIRLFGIKNYTHLPGSRIGDGGDANFERSFGIVDLHAVEAFELIVQPRPEVVPVAHILRAPNHLCKGNHPRHGHIFGMGRCGDELGPDISLGAQNVLCLLFVELSGNGFE